MYNIFEVTKMKYKIDDHLSAAIPHQMKDWLAEEADRNFTTISQLVRKIVTHYQEEMENARNKQNTNKNSDVE